MFKRTSIIVRLDLTRAISKCNNSLGVCTTEPVRKRLLSRFGRKDEKLPLASWKQLSIVSDNVGGPEMAVLRERRKPLSLD